MEQVGRREAANTLLIADASEPCDKRACSTLLDGTDRSVLSIIGVTLRETADQWLADFQDRVRSRTDELYLLSGGEFVRSAAGADSTSAGIGRFDVELRTLENPRNLTRLGVALTDIFDEVAPGSDAATTAMCFRPLSALPMQSDPKPVYKFLNILTSHVASHGITAHYHLDPTAHDERTVAQLKTLFDAVMEIDESSTELEFDRLSALS